MPGAEVQFVGADRLALTLDRAAAELADLTAAGEDATRPIASSARSRAPRRSGRLAASIEYGADPTSAFAGAGAEYARPIEYGWPVRGIRAQPFLAPAAAESDWSSAYERAVGQTIERVEGA